MFLGSRARQVRRADKSVSRLSIQCGILNISQPYRLPRPVTGIAFDVFIYNNVLETGFCLRLEVEPTQFGLIYVLNKNRSIDDDQKHNNCTLASVSCHFSQSLQAYVEIVSLLGHDHFLSST
jgi:hypothetical protein